MASNVRGYLIVNFIVDNTIAIVSTEWVIRKNGVRWVYWPAGSQKLAKRHAQVDPEKWLKYEFRKLYSAGKHIDLVEY